MRSNLRAESDIQMDILLRENETPGEGERPLPDNSHTFLKKGKVGKMKQRKRRPQGNSQREEGRQGRSKGKGRTQPRYHRGQEGETRGTTVAPPHAKTMSSASKYLAQPKTKRPPFLSLE